MSIAHQSSNAVVLLVELQPQIVASCATTSEDDLRRSVSVLVEVANALDVPVFSSVVEHQPGVHPEVIEEVASIAPLQRTAIGALDEEAIRTRLEKTGRRILAIGGVSSEIAVLHAAIGGVERGYDVHVLVDCCGGLSARTEAVAFRQMEKAGATVSNLSSFLTGLTRSMDDPAGHAVFAGLARLWSWGADSSDGSDVP